MARLVLIFAVLVCFGAAIQFGVNGQIAEADIDTQSVEEESYARGGTASASAKATAQAGSQARPGPYPAPPGPYPPRPYPPGPGPNKQVQCYACSGCQHVGNATTKYCPYSADPMKNGKCIVYSEKYYHMKQSWVIRGCVSERGTCAEIRTALSHQADLVKLRSCRDCEGDRCNSAGHSTPDVLAALLAMFITPLLIKHTLS